LLFQVGGDRRAVRLLVLDPSHILPWIVRHDRPDLEVEEAADLDEAVRRVAHDPPDAAVVSLPPARLPWHDFQHLCASRVPAVPVLYESCLPVDAGGVGLDPGDGYAAFLEKPASRAELADALERLLEIARREREEAPA
jgi:DNA-binding NtrC family response regulator